VSAAGVLPTLREAFGQRPAWREFSPRQLSVLMFLHGYTSEPAEEFEIAAALPFALEDVEGAA
jgi:pimeloyl-ACP methyl ester carboxylesterase